MRVPRFKVYRAFEELDSLDNYTCEGLVRKAEINHSGLVVVLPRYMAFVALVAWPAAAVIVRETTGILDWLVYLGGPALHIVLLIVSDAAVTCVVFFIARDACLWLGLRRELRRTHCPKCSQPMVGLPIRTVGDDNDPAKRFIICPECGRKFMLLDLGLTPLDLVPYEQREMMANPAARRPKRPGL